MKTILIALGQFRKVRASHLRLAACLLITACAVLLFFSNSAAQSGIDRSAVTTGSEKQARAYYAQLKAVIAFDAIPGTTKLDDLLSFLGYPTTGDKLLTLDPAVLMNPARAGSPDGLGIPAQGLSGATLRDGDILAARFFAPKIVNIGAATPIPGWRKLVRLRVRPDSRASRAGIESAVVLFNFFTPVGQQPFQPPSINTQVMLLAPFHPERLFWLDFDSQGVLGLALTASFDAADLPGGATRNYFVPDGCNACHGSPGNLRPPMVNYLDTDHWFDRLDSDFPDLKAANTPLLFDAGTNDTSSPLFAGAFDVIRRFNEEALFQNFEVQPEAFEALAAQKWLSLHAASNEHFPPISRAFSAGNTPKWQAAEADGLNRLNRYCFRCHGSVRFSVFDRQAVVDRAGAIRQRIKPSAQQAKVPGFKMPPDRILSDSELQALDDFVKNLK